LTGAALTATVSYALVWMINWVREGRDSGASTTRVAAILALLIFSVALAYVYIRRQWLQYLRLQTLAQAGAFVSKAQHLDIATAAAMTLVQEVELVSRGYRM
jgi:hypothetical protein